MADWSCDVTVSVHQTDIELIVTGTPVRNDTSVGEPEGWSLEDAHLCWADETPVLNAVLFLGKAEVERAITFANKRLLEEGPPGPDPDYLRDLRGDVAA